MRFWRFRSGRGAFGGIGVGRVLLKTGQNLCGTSSPEPQNLQNLPDPRQNLARTLTELPRQNLRTSERDPRRFWRFWRGLGEVFGGSEVLGQNLRFCIQNLVLVLYAAAAQATSFSRPSSELFRSGLVVRRRHAQPAPAHVGSVQQCRRTVGIHLPRWS